MLLSSASEDDMDIDVVPSHGEQSTWILNKLPSIPHFQAARPQVSARLQILAIFFCHVFGILYFHRVVLLSRIVNPSHNVAVVDCSSAARSLPGWKRSRIDNLVPRVSGAARRRSQYRFAWDDRIGARHGPADRRTQHYNDGDSTVGVRMRFVHERRPNRVAENILHVSESSEYCAVIGCMFLYPRCRSHGCGFLHRLAKRVPKSIRGPKVKIRFWLPGRPVRRRLCTFWWCTRSSSYWLMERTALTVRTCITTVCSICGFRPKKN